MHATRTAQTWDESQKKRTEAAIAANCKALFLMPDAISLIFHRVFFSSFDSNRFVFSQKPEKKEQTNLFRRKTLNERWKQNEIKSKWMGMECWKSGKRKTLYLLLWWLHTKDSCSLLSSKKREIFYISFFAFIALYVLNCDAENAMFI